MDFELEERLVKNVKNLTRHSASSRIYLNLHILLWFSRLPQIQIFRNVFSASPTLLKKFSSSHLRQFNGFCPGVKNAMKRSIEGHSIRSSVVLSYSLLYVLTFFQPFSKEFHIHFSIKARAFNFLKRNLYFEIVKSDDQLVK